jgi:hypothetical protein
MNEHLSRTPKPMHLQKHSTLSKAIHGAMIGRLSLDDRNIIAWWRYGGELI